MRDVPSIRGLFAALFVLFSGSTAHAQLYEAVGTRAQGMAGAFVADANDATATWWNPAGLASGTLFDAIVQGGDWTQPADVPPAGPAVRQDTQAVAVLYPALALSYYRLRISEIAPTGSTAGGDLSRQDQGPGPLAQRAVTMTQFGASFGQTVTPHVVLASTVRLVRAGLARGVTGAAGPDALDQAADIDVDTELHGDLDLGAMVTMGRARIGLSVKHVNEPAFGDEGAELVLARQARVGLSVTSGAAGPLDAVVAAVDLDLTTAATAVGDVRHVAAGAEAWLWARRLGVRGGLSANAAQEMAASASVGGSLALRRGFYVDGAYSAGSDTSRRGWSAGVRVTF
jgi:hypothetical protein